MNLQPQKREELQLDVTPLIDVVFLLLIFFMVSTTFQHKSDITINLPKASETATQATSNDIRVSIDVKGRVFVNEHALVNSQLDTIRSALREAKTDIKKPRVIISADARATHQSVMTVMDAARQLGLVHITFAAEKREDSGSE